MEVDYQTDTEMQSKMVAYCYDNIQYVMKEKQLLPYPEDLPTDKFPVSFL
jgi:hypothetical protein